MEKTAKIYVAGHRGLVGSAIVRALDRHGFSNLILRTHAELDLRRQLDVERFFELEKPDYVFLAAARVGGIHSNDIYRGDFIVENLQIQTNVIHSARMNKVRKLIFLGSSCIYPKFAAQPMREDALLTGPLESTNEAYAVAKIAGIMTCKSLRIQYGAPFISVMPTNLYGPNDNYDLKNSHVLPALIRKFHEAKVEGKNSVTLWGTGAAYREFLYSDDLAEAVLFLMENYNSNEHINIGSGREQSIADLALCVKKVVGYSGDITWDVSKPDGTPRKLMDSARLFSLGWRPRINLEEGIRLSYEDFKKTHSSLL